MTEGESMEVEPQDKLEAVAIVATAKSMMTNVPTANAEIAFEHFKRRWLKLATGATPENALRTGSSKSSMLEGASVAVSSSATEQSSLPTAWLCRRSIPSSKGYRLCRSAVDVVVGLAPTSSDKLAITWRGPTSPNTISFGEIK